MTRLGLGLLLGVASVLAVSCGAPEPSSPPPQPWTGFFHPPPKPGSSISSSKQCECRACDPASCCHADHLESTAQASPECNSGYDFSDKCGIQVSSCTPRCYSHVWRVSKQEDCGASRPLVCCD